MYLKYHKCPSPRPNWDPHPLFHKRVCPPPPPEPKGEGTYLPAGEGAELRGLKNKPSANRPFDVI